MLESARNAARHLRERYSRWDWHRRVTAKAGPPYQTIGPGDTLNLLKNEKRIRIAPCRRGEQVASFWRFWMHGNEIYAAGRNHIGLHKLSFHRSGRWHTELAGQRKPLAPGKLLPGGQWRHAMQLVYLIGNGILPPLPEEPFGASGPGYMFEILPGEQLIAHLLIGAAGATLESPLPEGFEGYSLLLPMMLRDGGCAILIGGQIPMQLHAQEPYALARGLRMRTNSPPDMASLRTEVFSVQTLSDEVNLVNVIPLGPETVTSEAPRPGA